MKLSLVIMTTAVVSMSTAPTCSVAAIAAPKSILSRSCARKASKPFRVFNALTFGGQPNMADFGMEPIHIIDRDIWAPNVPRSGPPDPVMVRRYTQSLKADGAPIVLDFEDFPVAQSAELAADSVFRLRRILKAFRAAAPERPIGYYSYLPLRDYWRRIKGRGSPEFRAWQSQNDRVKPLERDVSMLFPSLYTLYEDRDGWRRFAIDNICEARRISHKPVYIFLWPGYENPAFMGRPVEGSYWAMELELAHQYADGIVLWGGANVETNSGTYPWNPNAGWWTETRKFLKKIGLHTVAN